jgi:hypothetical protein
MKLILPLTQNPQRASPSPQVCRQQSTKLDRGWLERGWVWMVDLTAGWCDESVMERNGRGDGRPPATMG